MTLPTKTELRDAVFSRLDTYTDDADLPWIGSGADLAFADSVIALGGWYERERIIKELEDKVRMLKFPKTEEEGQTSFTVRLLKAEAYDQVIDSLKELQP